MKNWLKNWIYLINILRWFFLCCSQLRHLMKCNARINKQKKTEKRENRETGTQEISLAKWATRFMYMLSAIRLTAFTRMANASGQHGMRKALNKNSTAKIESYGQMALGMKTAEELSYSLCRLCIMHTVKCVIISIPFVCSLIVQCTLSSAIRILGCVSSFLFVSTFIFYFCRWQFFLFII